MFNPLKITKLLEEKRVTVKEFLEKVEISKQTYYNLMNNGGGHISTLEKIADFFKLSIDFFFDRECKIVSVNGNKNQVGNGNVIIESQANEIEHLKQLLEEKERTIQILMKK